MTSFSAVQLHAEVDKFLQTIPLRTHELLSIMIPVLFNEDPLIAAKLVRNNREARAVALKLPSGDPGGDSLFAIALRIDDWVAATGFQFDKRFSLYSHETEYHTIMRIHDWERSSELPFDKRFTIEQHELNYSLIFERRLADWGESAEIREAYSQGKNVALDLRGFRTIPDVLGAIPNLRGLIVDEGVVLPRFPRKVELNLLAANPSIFLNMRPRDESFIIDALKQNCAALQFLPPEIRFDMVFLLRAAMLAPGIIAYIPEPIRSQNEFMLSLVKSAAFGQEAWETHFGAVDEAPPLPETIVDILCSSDPFNPGKKIAETHMLFLLPRKVNGQPLTMKSFRELIKAPLAGYRTDYRHIWIEQECEAPDEAHWILMTKDVIPGSRSRTYKEQQKGVNQGYLIPDLLSATVGILTHYVKRGERLFSTTPLTYTRIRKSPYGYWFVGGFSPDGIFFSCTSYFSNLIGVAAMRRLA